MGRYLSARHILSLAKIVEAVQEGRTVRWEYYYDGQLMEGTLRGFTSRDSGAHFTGEDLRDSYVRITTVQGSDFWIETEEMAGLYEDGSLVL